MRFGVLIEYKNIFPHEKDILSELVKGIPSTVILSILSALSSELYWGLGNPTRQMKALNHLFLRRQALQTQLDIQNNIQKFLTSSEGLGTESFAIFALRPLLKFMEYELINYREIDQYEDSKPIDELNLLKAILLFNEEQHNKIGQVYFPDKRSTKEMFYYEKTWPIMMVQYNIQIRENPIYQLIKGILLLLEVSKGELREYIERFVTINGKNNIHEYGFEIINLIIAFNNIEGKKSLFASSILNFPEEYEIPTFYDSNSIDPQEFLHDKESLMNYKGLRSKPLHKYKNRQFAVLHWGFLQHKLYEGLIFDFLKVSGVSAEKGLDYPKFKSKYSGTVIEKIIFKNIMTHGFQKKGKYLHFESGESQPDLYYRSGNVLTFFEFKDASFASKAIEMADYESIKEEIERKICSKDPKPVGVYQLVNNIKMLQKGYYQFDFELPSLHKLSIQPVIVVTDFMFEMPGVNRYINRAFNEEINETRSAFNKIEDVVIINFDFLFTYINQIKDGEYKIQELITKYNRYIAGKQKQLNSSNLRADTLDKLHINFTDYAAMTVKLYKHPRFVESMFNIFDMKYGLLP